MISLTINTEPVAKARARTVVRNGKVHSFTPSKTKTAEDIIRYAIIQRFISPPYYAKTPLLLSVVFFCKKPASKPEKEIYPVCNPDVDNYIKTLLDAGNHCLWHDDSQIVGITATKIYGKPRIEITLREVYEEITYK